MMFRSFIPWETFCCGGHTNLNVKDSVIVQAEYERDNSTGDITRTRLQVILCQISTRSDRIDYCLTPCQEGTEDYQRILQRLEFTGKDK